MVIWEGIGVTRRKFLIKNIVFVENDSQCWRKMVEGGTKLAPRATQMEPEWTASLEKNPSNQRGLGH